MKIIVDENMYTTFYIGQNIKENDELYYKMKDDSFWFHLDDETSSHVYCVCKIKITRNVINKASMLVRKYSKNQKCKVIYTDKKNLTRLGPGIMDVSVFKIA